MDQLQQDLSQFLLLVYQLVLLSSALDNWSTAFLGCYAKMALGRCNHKFHAFVMKMRNIILIITIHCLVLYAQ